jgi:acyl-CoA synthetase (AMP-forming)/AMP-acid ligase II
VERALLEHPLVLGSVVFGMPDPGWGEAVCAAVATRATLVETELRSHLAARVARYKIPKRVLFVALDDLPVGSSGKPNRKEARQRFRGLFD